MSPDALVKRQLILAQATVLARRGRYEKAEHILLNLARQHPSWPPIFDLLARIYAQQDRLADAQQYWKHALSLDAMNPQYLAAYERVVALRQRPEQSYRLSSPMFKAAIIALLSILLLWFFMVQIQSAVERGLESLPHTIESAVATALAPDVSDGTAINRVPHSSEPRLDMR
ncbi:MAG: hypothetical protein EA396_12370 [Anaerolineaceae bacterium]|nr:MAG: hypothetical protein EA396_12370 [Anaerolineaceae bacterium]